MMFATDCLASTGFNPAGLIALAILLAVVGVAALWLRKSLSRGTALLLIVGAVSAGLFGSAVSVPSDRAQAAVTSCGSSIAPTPSVSSSPSGSAPIITNEVTTFNNATPFTVTATGTGPITFTVYTFTMMQFGVTRMTLDPNTGAITPPDMAGRNAACYDNGGFGNTMNGVTFTVVATNSFGSASKSFTINDAMHCM